MNEERLKEIRARCEAATEGPWVGYMARASGKDVALVQPAKKDRGEFGEFDDIICEEDDIICEESVRGNPCDNGRDNMQFIAHARQDVPDLLDEVERLRRENEVLEGYAKEWEDA